MCLLFIGLQAQLLAETCNLADEDFPDDDCSFSDLGINPQMLKFGEVDAIFEINSGSTNVRFGAALFILPDTANLYNVDGDDCVSGDGDDIDNIANVEDVAFIPSTADPRMITDIWILDCDIVQDR